MWLQALIDQISSCSDRIAALEAAIIARCRSDRRANQLITVPGVGPLTAASIMAAAPDPARFRNGRHFAAWLGLVAGEGFQHVALVIDRAPYVAGIAGPDRAQIGVIHDQHSVIVGGRLGAAHGDTGNG